MNEPTDRDILLYQDRTALLRAVTFPLAIMAGTTLLLLILGRSKNLLARLTAFISGISLAGWGYLTIPSLLRLLVPQPLVVVNQHGITYNPPSAAFLDFGASLAWDEIAALYPLEWTIGRPGGTSAYNFLCIVPRDVEAFLRRRTFMNMTVMVILMNQTHVPFMIPEPTLPISVHALLAHICVLYADEIRAHGIEIGEQQANTLLP